jgi:hypothetical protein
VRIDLYTKLVLTIIAFALVIIAIRPESPLRAMETQGPLDVRIIGIVHPSGAGGKWDGIDVNCINCR